MPVGNVWPLDQFFFAVCRDLPLTNNRRRLHVVEHVVNTNRSSSEYIAFDKHCGKYFKKFLRYCRDIGVSSRLEKLLQITTSLWLPQRNRATLHFGAKDYVFVLLLCSSASRILLSKVVEEFSRIKPLEHEISSNALQRIRFRDRSGSGSRNF